MSTPSPASTPPMSPASTGTATTNATSISSSPDVNASQSPTPAKSTRRQASYYPNLSASNGTKQQKPFSRSAAKRESVMTLGSIEHLQHYFTKTGIAAKKNPLAKTQPGLVPAIGGLTHIRTSPSITSQFPLLNLPPSPLIPEPPPVHPTFPKHDVKTETNPETLKALVIEDLKKVEQIWGLETGDNKPSDDFTVDVLGLLKATTRTIRSTRNYLVALPDEDAGTIRANFRPHNLGPASAAALARSQASSSSRDSSHTGATSTPTRSSTATPNVHSTSTPGAQTTTTTDPLTLIRRSALEVLSVLRTVEETCRLPLTDSAYDALDLHGGAHHSLDPSDARSESTSNGAHSRIASPDIGSDAGSTSAELLHPAYRRMESDSSIRFIQVQGRHGPESIPVWEDEEDEDPFLLPEYEEGARKRERWDEKIEAAGAINSGWLYRQDVILQELEKERKVVETYLDVVDAVLFSGTDQRKADSTPASSAEPLAPSSPTSEERKSRTGERGWDKERRKTLLSASSRPKSKGRTSRRASAGGEQRTPPSLFLSPGEVGGKRRVSTGMLNMGLGGVLTEEPDGLHGESSTLGGIGEEDEEDGLFTARQGILEEEEEEELEEVDDEDLPDWARRDFHIDDDLGRAHAILSTFLSARLASVLAPAPEGTSASREAFLASLSSGQLLCTAYNAVVRNSKHPWGYVNKDAIHDIAKLEAESGEGARKGWTFRRTDNLRLWAGAMKLRYMLPIQLPSAPVPVDTPSIVPIPLPSGPGRTGTPLASPTKTSHNITFTHSGPRISISGSDGVGGGSRKGEDPIPFDAKVVARKDEGWDTMLENVLVAWVRKVVSERREAR